MNTSLVKTLGLSNEESEVLMQTLMKRYNEYKDGIISDKKKKEIILPDWATAIAKNITAKQEPIIDMLLIFKTAIHFTSFMKLISDLVNKQFKVTKLN